MITFLAGVAFGAWLGAYLVWRWFERSIRDGYKLCLSDTGEMTWRKDIKTGEQ